MHILDRERVHRIDDAEVQKNISHCHTSSVQYRTVLSSRRSLFLASTGVVIGLLTTVAWRGTWRAEAQGNPAQDIAIACTDAEGTTVRPFITSDGGTRSVTFPVTVPGLPVFFSIALPEADDLYSLQGEDGTETTVQRRGSELDVTVSGAMGGETFRCSLASAPPPGQACAQDQDRAIEQCMNLYAAAHPACAGEKDALVPPDRFAGLSGVKNAAVAAATTYLPPWYLQPRFLSTLLESDPELQQTLRDIEGACGETLRIAVTPSLPCPGGSCLSGLFSADAFTVYLRDPLPEESAHAILRHEFDHALTYCRNGKEMPSVEQRCAAEREAMFPLCQFLVTAFGNSPDPAIQNFLCALSSR